MIISLLVAMDLKRGIGKNNQIPWYLPSDLKRFKKITMGHCIIMGRKTYESIGKVLPGRIMIILTKNKKYSKDGCIVVDSLKKAIEYAKHQGETELFIIGGGDIFAQSVKIADRIYLTKVQTDVDADVFFPVIEEDQWIIIKSEKVDQEKNDQYSSIYQVLSRKK